MCIYLLLTQSRNLEGYERIPPHDAQKPQRHDPTRTFSIMRTRGRIFNEDNNASRGNNLTIDALSIGTQFNFGLLEAQSRTWASHGSIRHYFAATELDDADQNCHKTLTRETIEEMVQFCREEKPRVKGNAMRNQCEQFANGFKSNGPGWFCAQQRAAVALETLGKFYRIELEVHPKTLPDFLLLQDDDTWYNMLRIESYLKGKDGSVPLAESLCLIRLPESENFSFPWGGFGLILSRGAIDNLIRPIFCDSNRGGQSDEFQRNVCSRLKDNILGEQQYFRDGMSVSDLMGAHVRNNLFAEFSRHDWSYCLHSDWSVGYYVNYYYLSNHVKDPEFAESPEQRIESTLGDELSNNRGNCVFGDVDSCNETAHVCHGQTAKSMIAWTREIAASAPGVFRNY